MVVLVTGANGQLGQALQFVSGKFPGIRFVFCTSAELNIADKDNCESVFFKVKPDYCINAAAYTAVDMAESEPEKSYLINVAGTKNIAESCRKYDTTLLHISTDFVFDGNKKTPYTEKDFPNPESVYGRTKLAGEAKIQSILSRYFIIRTSWVYSCFGNNFMKTMIRLGNERDSLSVVDDQIGTPTNALDLAETLIKIIVTHTRRPLPKIFGIYNFSNEGQCSWYDFAKKIFEIHKIEIDLQAIPTALYPTPAKRPRYSVLEKAKIKKAFGIEIKSWEESLKTISA